MAGRKGRRTVARINAVTRRRSVLREALPQPGLPCFGIDQHPEGFPFLSAGDVNLPAKAHGEHVQRQPYQAGFRVPFQPWGGKMLFIPLRRRLAGLDLVRGEIFGQGAGGERDRGFG